MAKMAPSTPAQEPPAPSEADIDLDLLDYLQSLSPAERLKRQVDAQELVRTLRAAGARLHGLDSRHPSEAD
jgi:hypothetical protein